MEYIYGLKSFESKKPSAVMIGKFDGFHRGHQKLLDKVRELAEKDGTVSVVIAFDMVPLLQQKGLLTGVLMERSEKRAYLKDRVDYFVDCPFDKSLAQTRAEDFVRELCAKLNCRHVVVGADFRFGKDRLGDVKLLEKMQDECGYRLHIVPDVPYGNSKISSHLVKEDLVAGRFDSVNEQLGHPWQIYGKVGHGKAIGKSLLDMATINIAPDPVKALPPFGVYVVSVEIGDKIYKGVADLGVKPTVSDDGEPRAEVHLIDYDGDLYGKNVVVSFYKFLREEKKFDDVGALKEQMHKDLQQARKEWEEI